MANIFTSVQLPKVASNSFSLTHDVKLSCNMGKLIPINVMECLPGDKIKGQTQAMLRLAPMLAPIMHKVDVKIEHFFVSNRLVWPGWEKFIVAGVPDVNTPAHPYLTEVPSPIGGLSDYFGMPASGQPYLDELILNKVNAIPYACYNKIYNDYYRDENLVAELTDTLTDGQNVEGLFNTIHNRAWQHDYFTSCLPWAQKGNAVSIPVSQGFAPIVADKIGGGDTTFSTVGVTNVNVNGANSGYLYSDQRLSEAEITINTLRWAVQLQTFLERNARGGTRYIENILVHFGVKSSDKRLQRAEYLGGSSNPIIISEVLQTSETATTALGEMGGHGLSVGRSNNVNYYAEEHGWFFTIMSILPRTSYQQGLPRQFSKFDPLDYAWPEFANLGEQEVLSKELYYQGLATDENTFGYLPRYSEYKFASNRVAGDMRGNLDYWHMGRKFNSRPTLNSQFITANPTHRIFNVEDESIDKIYAQIVNNLSVRRCLPKYGIPTLG